MKKILFALVFALVLLFSCECTLPARGGGKDRGNSTKGKSSGDRRVRSNSSSQYGGKRNSDGDRHVSRDKKRSYESRTKKETTSRKRRSEKTAGDERSTRRVRSKRSERVAEKSASSNEKTKGRRRSRYESPTAEEPEDTVGDRKPKDRPGSKDEKDKSDANKARGQDHAQQRRALDKQIAHEERKHQVRKARLERMREVAAQKGDDKAVERIDELMDKEQQRYDRKRADMEKRGESIEEKATKGDDEEPGDAQDVD